MPSKSKKQHKFMEAVAHSASFAKKAGVPQSVGKDFSNADKGKTFKQGGDMASKMNPGFMAMIAKKKAGASGMAAFEKSGKDKEKGMKEGSKKDMMMDKMQMKKMASGGFVRAADGVASKGKTKATQIKMNKGGKAC
jgi:hypothetical protein